MGKPGLTRSHYLICAFLIVAVLVIYWQALGFEFINYDDDVYIYNNPAMTVGLTPGTVRWALTTSYAANWHPLTWISHLADATVYGTEPLGHHLTSLLLHLAAAIGLFFVLNRMTKSLWRSAFVAALFAVHPLHVESVAWVAERKDVLSTFFAILTLLAYVRYVELPDSKRYMQVVLAFALGLMAKPMLVTLPIVLLLLDYWPLGRFSLLPLPSQAGQKLHPLPLREPVLSTVEGRAGVRGIVFEKLPLFAMAAASCVVTFLVQREGGAVSTVARFTFSDRAANALVSYVRYIEKMLWPRDLAFFYPHPGHSIPAWQVAGASLFIVLATVLAVRCARKRPYITVGWLWYLVTLVPVIGLVQVGWQAMADRYTYLPLTGLFIVIAWGVPDLLGRSAIRRALIGACAVIVLVALTACAHTQAGYWRDSVTLCSHALKVTTNNSLAAFNMGGALDKKGLVDEAIVWYRRTLRMQPDYVAAHFNLGSALALVGKQDEAIAELKKTLRYAPNSSRVHNNIGTIYAQQGKMRQAMAEFAAAVKADPRSEEARNNLAQAKENLKLSGL